MTLVSACGFLPSWWGTAFSGQLSACAFSLACAVDHLAFVLCCFCIMFIILRDLAVHKIDFLLWINSVGSRGPPWCMCSCPRISCAIDFLKYNALTLQFFTKFISFTGRFTCSVSSVKPHYLEPIKITVQSSLQFNYKRTITLGFLHLSQIITYQKISQDMQATFLSTILQKANQS